MNTRVAVPVLFSSLRLHLEKGRQWNVVEHLLLHRLLRGDRSAATLASEADLPWRLIVEVMVRLMRVGWVDLQSADDETRFRITDAGKAVVNMESLPKVTRPLKRRGSFAVEQLTGTVFRSREFATLYSQQRLDKLVEIADVLVLPSADSLPTPQPHQIVQTLLDEDEECKDIDASGARPGVRYAVVTVSGETIEGLPASSSPRLRARILAAVSDAQDPQKAVPDAPPANEEATVEGQWIDITFSHHDLVVGGKEHQVLFERLLKTARSRVVVHSTFIEPKRFRHHLPLIEAAARRGVQVDILWGKSDDADGSNSTADAVSACRAMLLSDVVKERVRLHGVSTDSHAKLLLADTGAGGLIGVVGSCNWLSSEFASFEVSATLRDPRVVADVAGRLSAMSMGQGGLWTPLTRELASLATTARSMMRVRQGVSCRASLVLGSDHADYVRLARDEARRQITVASHRFSPSAETLVLTPARVAMQANGIDVTVYYGRVTGVDGGSAAVGMGQRIQQEGMRLRQFVAPTIHAKFLAWDDDSVVITSQNWLSADPGDSQRNAEIGVFLKGKGIASELVGRVKLALEGV
jgi:cardiolipin synthase A/B